MKKYIIVLFCLFICYVVYNETTRESRFKRNNKKENNIENKVIFSILDSVTKSHKKMSLEIDKLNSDNHKHSMKNKKMKDSLAALIKDRKNLLNKVQNLEREKSTEMFVQKSDTIKLSEK